MTDHRKDRCHPVYTCTVKVSAGAPDGNGRSDVLVSDFTFVSRPDSTPHPTGEVGISYCTCNRGPYCSPDTASGVRGSSVGEVSDGVSGSSTESERVVSGVETELAS